MSDQGPDTLERIVPDRLAGSDAESQALLRIHQERYEFAARYVRPGRLLDLACGVGYGTRLLADRCPDVEVALGVDLSEASVRYAQERYGSARVQYRVGDAMTFQDAEGFDTLVSLETVEHLPEPQRYLDRAVGLLRPGGVLIASVPTTPSVDLNPHHLHDFTERSFRRAFVAHSLVETAALRQRQPVALGPVLRREDPRLSEVRTGLVRWYLSHPGALGKRIVATLRYGFANRYLTLVMQAVPESARPSEIS